jgi:DNA-binding transcriptional LysR family regulator
VELDWLEDFTALATAQTFSRAAELRNITQPAFSRRVQMLERWVGTPLFQRHARRTTLTPAGEQFRNYAEAITRDLMQARHAAQDAAGRSSKALTIAATHALSFTFFPHWVRTALDAESLGALSLLSDNMMACEDMMVRGQAQFLLCHRHPSDPGRLSGRQFRDHRVGADRLVPCVAPDASGRPLWSLSGTPSDQNLPFLAYTPQSGLGRILAADWKARDIHPPLAPVMAARLAAALLNFAEDGRGIAWLPYSLAADSLAVGRLVMAAADERWTTPVDIVLFRPVGRLPPAAEAFWAGILRS